MPIFFKFLCRVVLFKNKILGKYVIYFILLTRTTHAISIFYYFNANTKMYDYFILN